MAVKHQEGTLESDLGSNPYEIIVMVSTRHLKGEFAIFGIVVEDIMVSLKLMI